MNFFSEIFLPLARLVFPLHQTRCFLVTTKSPRNLSLGSRISSSTPLFFSLGDSAITLSPKLEAGGIEPPQITDIYSSTGIYSPFRSSLDLKSR